MILVMNNLRFRTASRKTKLLSKIFFDTSLAFTELEGNPGKSYFGEKPIDSPGIHETHKKLDYFAGKIINGKRQPILKNLRLNKQPGKKMGKVKIKHHRKINESNISVIKLLFSRR